jgi:IclR family acetate operon transcriptional repressor
MAGSDRYRIKVLEKVFRILDLFDDRGKELTAAEISARVGLNRATTFRILRQLEEAGYLDRSANSSKFRLGFRFYHLGSLVDGLTEIRTIARPFLEELVRASDETVHLVVLKQGQALYLDKIEGNKAVRVVSKVGMRLPAHCSGVGKVLLASLSDTQLNKVVKKRGLPRFTENTITDLQKLIEELERVREQGYAIDNEEIEVGLKCVAAPVRDGDGEVIAAISVSGPRERLQGKDLERLIAMVKQTAQRITNALAKTYVRKRVLAKDAL